MAQLYPSFAKGLSPFFTLNWSEYLDFLTFRGRLNPVTSGLQFSDTAHHHLAIAILFIFAGHMYKTNWGIGHSIKQILEGHKLSHATFKCHETPPPLYMHLAVLRAHVPGPLTLPPPVEAGEDVGVLKLPRPSATLAVHLRSVLEEQALEMATDPERLVQLVHRLVEVQVPQGLAITEIRGSGDDIIAGQPQQNHKPARAAVGAHGTTSLLKGSARRGTTECASRVPAGTSSQEMRFGPPWVRPLPIKQGAARPQSVSCHVLGTGWVIREPRILAQGLA